jgi:spore germination protein Q
MNYSSANYYTNGPDYYNFPAYRAAGGLPMSGMNQPQNLGGMQGSMQGGLQGGMPGAAQGAYPQMTAAAALPVPAGTAIPGTPGTPPSSATPGQIPLEQSYIENILRLNLGKIGTFYMTYENNTQWNAKVFKGKVEAAGRDHIIISDPKTGMRFLLLMVNLDYATFDEELKYTSPYQTGTRR